MSVAPNPTTASDDQLRGLFLCLTSVLVGVGLLMVYSASVTSWPTEHEQVYLFRHVTFLAIAATLSAIAARIPASTWYAFTPLLFWVTVGLLAAVLVPGVGTRVNGAQRWLRYGPVSLQPSEFAKISLVLYISRSVVEHRNKLSHWWFGTVPFLIPVACTVPFVLKEPDLGTSLFLLLGTSLVLFLGGWPTSRFVAMAGCGIPAGLWFFALKPYQWARIRGFLDSWHDIEAAPYQVKQSLLALGAGGITGNGLGRGWQKLSFLPEANTDFVFAVIGEELGLVGTTGVLVLWMAVFATGLRLVPSHSRCQFRYLVSFTLLSQLVIQAALNMAVATSLVPPKGIPHPLLSYGGNSLVASLIAIGIIVSFSRSTERCGPAVPTDESTCSA